VSEEKNLQDLMRQGVEAAREGRKAEAKDFFQQVVDQDDKNEKAWMWLASVVETDEERRVCLSNVLFINPNNERAQSAMAKLDMRSQQSKQDEEVIPGISRRQLLMFGGGGAAVIVLLLIIFLVITGSRNAQNAEATRVIMDTFATGTGIVAMAATENANGTATQAAAVTPTPTPTATSSNPTLPPEMSLVTATPTPAPTGTALPYPVGLSGHLVGWSGRDVTQTGYLPIVAYNFANNGEAVQLSNAIGRDPDLSSDGLHIVFTRYYSSTTYDTGIEEMGIDGSGSTPLTTNLDVIKAQMPNFCRTQNQIVFVGLSKDFQGDLTATTFPYQVFIYNLDKKELFRLTNDKASYSYPAYSPDCTRIAVVRTESGGTNAGSDIYLIDAASLAQTALTNDAAAYTESAPRWSPDGTQLTYSAYPKDAPNNSDIIVRRADPSSTPLVVVKDNADDLSPVFSPDGKYLAFSSNRAGSYDVYVLDQQTSTVYQLTNTVEEDFLGGWGP
jgi:Tol biopolymer transport system component